LKEKIERRQYELGKKEGCMFVEEDKENDEPCEKKMKSVAKRLF
jgi:hypothetical protein